MPADLLRARELFLHAVGKLPPEQWEGYVTEACGPDTELLRQVVHFLEVHREAGSFLESPAPGLFAAAPSGVREGPGSAVGPYRLLEQLGEGGCGVVFLAEQTQPVRRRVALKVIKPGMDTRQVVARFEAERQALALMDHPNIAHVLDGGETATGRPYFVMELVHGVPITAFCDQNRLTIRERLGLFVSVCRAVQHAHQKGVIHRDLKPSNVLVTRHDGAPVVKVIDFGVAKAAGRRLTETTLTHCAQLIGTPLYMSPEQAQLNGLDVDTRADVYALGVLLYELLTGTTPLDPQRLRALGLDEARRLIREEQPARPSTRLRKDEGGRMKDEAKATKPTGWQRFLPFSSFILHPSSFQELDWIVMRALEKDPDRRYETTSAFAADVQRYLNDEPVVAGPPSAGYRLRKFLRRNKGPVLVAGVIVLLLVAGIVGTTAGLLRALAAERQALRERDEKEEARRKALAAAAAEAQARRQTRRALNTMTDEVVEDLLGRQAQLTDQHREFLKKVLAYHEEFAAARADSPESHHGRAEGYFRVARIRHCLGELKEAESAYRDALALLQQLAAASPARPDFRRELALSHNNLGILLHETGRLKEAESAHRDALALRKRLAAAFATRPDFRQDLALTHNNLGTLLSATGRLKEAESAHRDALALREKLVAAFPTRPDFRRELASSQGNLGNLLYATGRLKEAESAYGDALALFQKLATAFPTNPDFGQGVASSHHNLGKLLYETGRPKEAASAWRDALALRKQLAAAFPNRPDFRHDLAMSYATLGRLLRATGRPKEAESACRDALALRRQLADDFPTRPDFRHDLALSHYSLGRLLCATGRLKEAESACGDALALSRQLAADLPTRPDFRHVLAEGLYNLGILRYVTGRPNEAEPAWREALTIGKKLAADCPTVSAYQNSLAGTLVNLALLHNQRREFAAALSLLEQARPHHQAALKASPKNPTYRLFYRNNLRALASGHVGLADHARAAATADELARFGHDRVAETYRAACYLGRCVTLAGKDARVDEARRQELAQTYADRALALLRQAVAGGYKDAARMRTEPALGPLRARAEFNKLLFGLESKTKE
jgi:serine/threonine protein kinase/tetratricopeptide (TPR) repeat protein